MASRRADRVGRVLARSARGAGPGVAQLGLLAALLGSGGGCCVPPPELAEILEYGFETPEQAFESFRTAVRADELELEYRCFSSGWKSRNGAGIQRYLIWRDELLRRSPFLRYGLATLELVEVRELGPRRVELQARTHGRAVLFLLAREDYWELFEAGELVADDQVEDLLADQVVVVAAEDDVTRLWGRVDVQDATLAGRFSRLTFGREWKIDDFAVAEPAGSP